MQIEFQGAARTVTGSMHVVYVNGSRILLDCGLYQGKRSEANEINRKFPFDPRSIDAVVLSHAHIDHSGNLPGLVKQGYRGPIYATPATNDLCAIMLADSGHIQEKDAEYINTKLRKHNEPEIQPLYTMQDATAAMELFQPVPYDKDFPVVRNLLAKFTDAGHILGSASIRLTASENGKTTRLGFTGDIGRWNMPIIHDPMFMGNVDALISESTYGGKLHDPPEDMGKQLAADLAHVIQRGGKIIVPAFSIGRTQDLVYALFQLFQENKLPRLPIFVDSPLAVNATDVYKKHPECFDEQTYAYVARDQDPFGFQQVHYVRSVEESKKLNDYPGSCMIIAASGMAEAGRILHHLANSVADPRNAVLIVGYQADHTLGKRLVDREPEVRIFGTVYKRNAEVIVHNSFSAHADGNELLKYIGMFNKQQLQGIFLVHGELARQEDLKEGLLKQGNTRIEIPVRGEKFDV